MVPSRLETKQVVAYISNDLHQILIEDADRQKRSVSAQLHYIVERYYAEHLEIRIQQRQPELTREDT
jgi:hypothetical protein